MGNSRRWCSSGRGVLTIWLTAKGATGHPVVRTMILVGLTLGVLATPAVGQLSDTDIALLQERAVCEGWTFSVGRNGATDRSLDELCGLVVPKDWHRGGRFDSCAPRGDLPAVFDWRTLGGCPPVRNQGACGSCWAFGTVGALECSILIVDGLTLDLSEQWLVSCNSDGWSCSGGWWAHDYHQWKTDPCGETGAVLESSFPYLAYDATCNCPYPHEYLIEDWAYIGSSVGVPPVDAIKQAIMDYGPVSVTVYANTAMQAYTGGVFNGCENATVNHAVVLVGWDDTQGAGGVWFMRNSWGSGWGESGYMRMEYGCSNIGYAACYVDYPGSDALEVTPHSGFMSVGDVGGPFTPECQAYTVTNNGPESLTWIATKTALWLDVVPTDGTLAAGESSGMELCIGHLANSLPGDVYVDWVIFTNSDTGFSRTREAALWIGPLFEVPIDADQSAMSVELCISEACDSDGSDIAGVATIQLDSIDNPSMISLFDFELEATDDLDLLISFGPLGAFSAHVDQLVVRHPQPGVPVGPSSVVADEFQLMDVPQVLEGTMNYTATGVACTLLQSMGLPCSDTMDLTELPPQSSSFSGTVTSENRVVFLSSQIEAMLLEAMASVHFSATINGQVHVPEPTPGDWDRDGDVDLDDFAHWPACMTPPGGDPWPGGCYIFDFESDGDVDLRDWAAFQNVVTGS